MAIGVPKMRDCHWGTDCQLNAGHPTNEGGIPSQGRSVKKKWSDRGQIWKGTRSSALSVRLLGTTCVLCQRVTQMSEESVADLKPVLSKCTEVISPPPPTPVAHQQGKYKSSLVLFRVSGVRDTLPKQ